MTAISVVVLESISRRLGLSKKGNYYSRVRGLLPLALKRGEDRGIHSVDRLGEGFHRVRRRYDAVHAKFADLPSN